MAKLRVILWRVDRNFEKREFIMTLALGEAGAFPPRQLRRCVVSLRGRDTGRGRVSRQERENKTSKERRKNKLTILCLLQGGSGAGNLFCVPELALGDSYLR